jgi:formamidopyrimidine-DNA glycosylase
VEAVPELPEIAAHAERLNRALAGSTLTGFEALSFTALKTFDPPPDAARGATLDGVAHRGKHLLLRFGELTFVVHLMQGGRLRPDAKAARRPRGGLARWHLQPAGPLLLTEAGTERKAGVWVVAGDAVAQEPLARLGPDADTVDADELAALLAEANQRLHTFLRDQSKLAGLGRRLANEVCHRARLSPFASVRGLGPDDVERLSAAIADSVAEGLSFERSLSEMSASAERPGGVHGRVGEPCPVCGDPIREVAYRDYRVHYCAGCQTGGKVLADNVTSKFLR